MVVSASGKKDMRSFTITDARRVDGCPTKFTIKGNTGRYIKRTPRAAAENAFNRLCKLKRIKGQCAMTITVKETTQGSSGKEFAYKLNRSKLAEPIMLAGREIHYDVTGESVRAESVGKSCRSGKAKSSGPMMQSSSSRSRFTKKRRA